ncbi:MAG: PAS domain S-box protein, partial [Desulfobulbaceae bacterium]|nr:PAS domain S-box protein [Desulfobulbaceae bacterium]
MIGKEHIFSSRHGESDRQSIKFDEIVLSMSNKPNYEELQRQIRLLEDEVQSLAMAQQVAQVGSWDWNLVDNTLAWSDETYRQFGLMPRELVPSYEIFSQFVHPGDLEILNERVQDALAGNKPFFIEARMIRKDGSQWLMLAQGTVYRDSGGEPIRFVGTQQDITKSRQTEEELRLQSEIMTHMAEGVYLIRAADGIIVFANEKFEKMFGYAPGEMIGQHVSIVNDPAEKKPEETVNEIMAALMTKGSWQGEVRNIRKDGIPFWCQASVTKFYHPHHGEVMISIHTDITERKLAEEALLESEKLSQLILSRSMDGFFSSDREGRFTDANEAYCNLVGYSREQLLEMRVPDVEAIETAEEVARHIEVLVRTGNERFETKHRHRSGDLVDIELSVNYDSSRGDLFFSFVRDISARKRIEAGLRENEEKFRLIFESSMDAIYQMDPEGIITFMNKAGAEMFGYAPEEIIGHHFNVLVAEDAVADGGKALRQTLAGDSVEGQILVKQRHGYKFMVSFSLAPLKKEEKIVGVTGISHDITDRLREEEKRLRESLAEKESLLKEIHHRVKNNMQIVSSLLSLQSMQSSNPDVQSAIRDSQNRVKTMGLIHEKLYKTENLSRIEFSDYLQTLTEYLVSTYSSS